MNSEWILILIILIVLAFFRIRYVIRRKEYESFVGRQKYESLIQEYSENIKQQEINNLNKELSDLIQRYRTHQITLRDKNGKIVNICPRCYATYVPVSSRRSQGKFLGCSNYPSCRSYGDIKKLRNLDIEWQI